MKEIVDRTLATTEMTSAQAKRSQAVKAISDSSSEAAQQTAKGAGVVVGITEDLLSQSQALRAQVEQFKVREHGEDVTSQVDRALEEIEEITLVSDDADK